MAIRFNAEKGIFHLTDANYFSFVLKIAADPACGNMLQQVYWGKHLCDTALENIPCVDKVELSSFDTQMQLIPFAYPTSGRGDFRPAALHATGEDGTDCAILEYESHEIIKGKPMLDGLPAVYAEDDAEADTLRIYMLDHKTGLKVILQWSVMNRLHILAQSVCFENDSRNTIVLHNPASSCIHLRGHYDMLHLHGAWLKERGVERVPAMHGLRCVSSNRGASGHQHNPFVALAETQTTEHSGNCYGMSLVYSGSHRMLVDENEYGYTRFVGGLNECSWHLEAGEQFQTPEMLLVYSDAGLNGMSQIFHETLRSRVCRGIWRDRVRPILVNNWEATYFDFNAEKILSIAKRAAAVGIELFALDDGWFGKRNSDASSLGDWAVNEEKLPGGLKNLADKINRLGLKFGLWVEPEMVSPDSNLYRVHPDWCLHIPGRPRSTKRNQLVLDMSRRDVQDYIINAISAVLESANIEYVKWDMNRNFCETGSAQLSAHRQGEAHHRYILGLYRVLEEITSRFPHVLFESCAGGGGRFDAGMLYYTPQTWTSDNTDAVDRLNIQYGTSMAYPCSAMGCHVSAVPNHQNGRTTSLKMRGDVAMCGIFGYELDLSKLTDAEMETVRAQVEKVKRLRALTMKGRFTRLRSPFEGDLAAWQFADEKREELLIGIFRRFSRANPEHEYIQIMDIDTNAWYVDDDGREYHGDVLRNVGLLPVFEYGDAASLLIHLKKR